MQEAITKNTFEILRKLKVVNESATKEVEKIERAERAKKSDFESDFWFDSEMEKPIVITMCFYLK